MKSRTLLIFAVGLPLAAQTPAQSGNLPQTYSFTATTITSGPATLKVNRNGSKEVVELVADSGGMHLRVLYDFQAHRIYTVDVTSKTCTTQQYASPYAPGLWDPIGDPGGAAKEAASLKTVRREAVNGIPARLVEIPIPDPKGMFRVWLDEKLGFPVKQTAVLGTQPERVVFEMRQLAFAPSAPDLFTLPANCTQIGGVSTATGGRAEMNVGVSAQGEASLGGAPAEKSSVKAGDGKPLLGKWEFTGKDGAGTAWRGALEITALEPNSFDPSKYSNVCEVGLSSANSGKGASGPCLYEPRTRTFTFAGGSGSNQYSFTGTLSSDGKSITQGKWVEGGKTGAWSAAAARPAR